MGPRGIVRPKRRGAPSRTPLPVPVTGCQEFAPPVTVVTPRRFCAQQDSFDSVQIGRSLPYEIVSIRPEETPRLTRYSLTAFARRAPSARLYSRVPRSSQ